jgi:pimeloyl-ACP methyl ester carboxylesterase
MKFFQYSRSVGLIFLLLSVLFIPAAHCKETTLIREIEMPILANGHQIGSIKLPAGSAVMLLSIKPDGVMISRGEAAPFQVARDAISPEALAEAQATPTPTSAPVTLSQGINASEKPLSIASPSASVSTPLSEPEWDAGPILGAALDTVQFRWWAPPDAKNLRGVIVLIPGRNGDGRGLTENSSWQEFATEIQFALIGCHFYGEKDHSTYQFDPTGDLCKAINTAVEKLAASNGHAELKSPPLVFWGHSAGGNVGQIYLKRYPERVLSAINLKGPAGPGDPTPAKLAIPYLIIIGSKDKPDWVKGEVAGYQAGKKNHALWTLALSPTEGHEEGKSRPLMIAFLRSAIGQRLPSLSANQSSSPPKHLNSSDGWLGNPLTYEIASNASYQGSRSEGIWLPDEITARAWQRFLKDQ